jgi:hypothetical protein
VRLAQHGHAAGDQAAVGERRRHPVAQVLLDAVHLEGRQELPVGQLGQAGVLAAHADERLDVVVPRLDVLVADRPVDADAFSGVGLEVQVAPPEAVARPEQRAAAHLVAAIPAELLHRVVRMVDVLDKKVLRVLAEQIEILLHRIVGQVLLRRPVAVRKLPWIEVGRRVVLYVLHHAAALQHERPQPRFGQLLGGPAAADSRAHDDGIEVGRHIAHTFCPGFRSVQPRYSPGTAM